VDDDDEEDDEDLDIVSLSVTAFDTRPPAAFKRVVKMERITVAPVRAFIGVVVVVNVKARAVLAGDRRATKQSMATIMDRCFMGWVKYSRVRKFLCFGGLNVTGCWRSIVCGFRKNNKVIDSSNNEWK